MKKNNTMKKNTTLNRLADKFDKMKVPFKYHFEFNPYSSEWEMILKHEGSDYGLVLKKSKLAKRAQEYFLYEDFSKGSLHVENNHVRNKDLQRMVIQLFKIIDKHYKSGQLI